MDEDVVPNLLSPPKDSLEDHVKDPGLVDISSNQHQSEVHTWVKSLGYTNSQEPLGDTDSQDLFNNLGKLFEQQEKKSITELYFIEKFIGWKKYHRASSVLTKGHHNMFYVPVWASAYSKGKKFGYVMYPKLTSVEVMLDEVLSNEENDLNQALRMCFASILGLDNLHTEGSRGSARPQYIHRAVCLDNMYVLAVKDINDNKVYGEAMLKLDVITKELDDGCQGNSWSDDRKLFEQYFHHPEAYKQPMIYTCSHDYFSYGVYILEVLSIAHKQEFDRKTPTTVEDKVSHYNKIAVRLKKKITNEKISKYLEIAIDFLNIENYKLDKDMTYVSQTSSVTLNVIQNITYRHEYPLNNHTSRLLAAIEENKGACYTPIQNVLKKDAHAVCQSCLIRLSVPLQTRCYQRDSEQKCTPSCKGFYCLQCYREGERLFCWSHGTTSPMLGHPWSYALLMYGEEWKGDDKQLFEENADFLANLMKLGLINGVPKQNVLVRSLISENPTVELKAHCKEIQNLIHRKVTIRCEETGTRTCHQTETTECCLTLAYIGHGTKEKQEDRGAWKPTKDGNSIEKSDVDQILGTIRDCGTAKCKASLIGLTYIKDHCLSSQDNTYLLATSEIYDDRRSHTPYIVKVSAVDHSVAYLGEITDFIGRLLTSSFDDYTSALYVNKNRIVPVEDNRMANSENGGVHPTGRDLNVDASRDLEREADILKHIIKSGKKLSYLTAKDLHNLSTETYDFKTQIDSTDPKSSSISYPAILAHFNDGGLKNRVFAWNPNDKDYDVGFAIKQDCSTIKYELRAVLGEDVGLVSSLSTDHSTYSLPTDDNISGMFGAATTCDRNHHKLYYLVIKDPIKVELIRNCERTSMTSHNFNVDLDKSQIRELVVNSVRRQGELSIYHVESDLPSLLVYMTRYLYDQKVGSVSSSSKIPADDSSKEKPRQTSSASDPHQISTSNPQDAVCNSFLRQIYAHKNPAVTVESLHLNDCKSSQLSHKDHVDDKLTVNILQSTVSISWTDTEPSTEEEGNSGDSPDDPRPDDARPDDARPEMETEDPRELGLSQSTQHQFIRVTRRPITIQESTD